ncbi:MAG TPA: MFS transporter [Thermomicrobiales bacterium]|nr:MFS transporter [Thermomicrobiales bacterium]
MTASSDAPTTPSFGWRQLLLNREHLAFALPGFIGRLPLAMRALGCVLLIQGITGEYGLAGLVGAAQTLVSAFASPRIGQLADRHGTRPVLSIALVIQTIGVIALITTAYASAPAPVLLLAAAVIGGSSVPFGSFSRARWTQHVARGRDLDRAYALEGVFEEISFIVGPALVVFLSIEIAPPLGLIVALLMTFVASAGLIRLPEIAHHAMQAPDAPRTSLLRNPVILVVAGSGIGMGILFGAIEISLVAFAEELGREATASALIAIFTVGSLVAAVLYGVLTISHPLRWRLLASVVWVGLWMIPTALAESLPAMIVCVLFAGIGISPWAISGSSMIERGVPAHTLREGFGWFSAATASGAALGATLAGMAIDRWESDGGQVVSILGGMLAIAVALLGQRRLRELAPGSMPL